MTPAQHDAARRPLRFVVLGESIISDLGNPVATSARAVLSALAESGHEVTFLEQRGNSSYIGSLRKRGSRFTREFAVRYPGIQVRTYDLPRGWERTVWLGREVGTADVVIALPGTPQELLPELVAYPSQHIVAFIDDSLPVVHDRFRLIRSPLPNSESSFWFGPAVLPGPSESARRSHPLIVVYDDAALGLQAEPFFRDRRPTTICTGSAELPGFRFVPEVELAELYAQYEIAYVASPPGPDWLLARMLLPIASGCHSISIAAGSFAGIEEDKRSLPVLKQSFDARFQASLLVSASRQALVRF